MQCAWLKERRPLLSNAPLSHPCVCVCVVCKVAAYCSRQCQEIDWKDGSSGVWGNRRFSPHKHSCPLERVKRAALVHNVPAMHGHLMAQLADATGRTVCTAHGLARCPRCTLDFVHFNSAVAAVASAGASYIVPKRTESQTQPRSETTQCASCGAVAVYVDSCGTRLRNAPCWVCHKWCTCCGRRRASSVGATRVCRQCLIVLFCRRLLSTRRKMIDCDGISSLQ